MNNEEKTIWQLQEELRQWHESEYKQEYPNSTFMTGKSLCESEQEWENLPDTEKERKERVAYKVNSMMFSMGVNVSDNFMEAQ